jgi:hypothetical protein
LYCVGIQNVLNGGSLILINSERMCGSDASLRANYLPPSPTPPPPYLSLVRRALRRCVRYMPEASICTSRANRSTLRTTNRCTHTHTRTPNQCKLS